MCLNWLVKQTVLDDNLEDWKTCSLLSKTKETVESSNI